MSARTGPANPWSGPRLPSGPDPRDPIHATADPANGERVPRCWTCGMPDHPEVHLLDFELRLGGKRAGRWVLCERCFWARNDLPTMVDPLQLPT
jgi:hypothetical protein